MVWFVPVWSNNGAQLVCCPREHGSWRAWRQYVLLLAGWAVRADENVVSGASRSRVGRRGYHESANPEFGAVGS